MSRVRMAVLLVVSALLLAGCGAENRPPSPPGPLGLTGDQWFWVIVIGIFCVCSALEAFGRRRGGGGS